MPRVRLTGLFLFITAILLGLAAATTRTSHIQIMQPDPTRQQGEPDAQLPPPQLQFSSVPIVYPLALVGLVGMVLWFLPAALFPDPSFRQKQPKSKRATSKKTSQRATSSRRMSQRRR